MVLLLHFEFVMKRKFGDEKWYMVIEDQGLIQKAAGKTCFLYFPEIDIA